MQVANALNNTIRILFNPKVEAFKLFDFLMVHSNNDRYIAQIIEIYDDKYDASQNVAKLKLFYKITPNNEVVPYDNFTPSKECEILKVKQEEIEHFINQGKETFVFATNIKNSVGLNLQYDFFNNNPIILADKIENSNAISVSLAKNLSSKKNTVIVDFTGAIEYKEAKKIIATKNFKMPLNYDTLDYVFQKCLKDSSLEFQAIGYEIMNEIKKFAKGQENGYIPFSAFVKVLATQYKATPYPDLKLFAARIKRCQTDELFVRTKKDFDGLEKTIQKNSITIVDLSGIESFWQKAYFEYIISSLKEDVYLIARINDENFDVDMISKMYNRKPNISFVPNVSYNYSKLPSIVQYCENYILMPGLNQRNDFLDANFALCNLVPQGCIVFGKNTDNFLYLAKDYELEVQEEKKNYRKIDLTEDAFENEQYTNTNFQNRELIQELDSNIASLEMQQENIELIENIDNSTDKNEDFFLEAAEQMTEAPEAEEPEEKAFEAGQIFGNSEKEETQATEELQTTEEVQEEPQKSEVSEMTDEELDFYEAPNTDIEEENVVIDDIEYKVQSDDDEDENQQNNQSAEVEETIEEKAEEDSVEKTENKVEETPEEENIKEENVNLSEIADNVMEDNFEEILNSSVSQTPSNNVEMDDSVLIPLEVPEAVQQEPELPIFTEQIPQTPQANSNNNTFETGDRISHDKYGNGKIVKIIQYDQRQLLQIEFEDSGKKLLDPKVASINKL